MWWSPFTTIEGPEMVSVNWDILRIMSQQSGKYTYSVCFAGFLTIYILSKCLFRHFGRMVFWNFNTESLLDQRAIQPIHVSGRPAGVRVADDAIAVAGARHVSRVHAYGQHGAPLD